MVVGSSPVAVIIITVIIIIIIATTATIIIVLFYFENNFYDYVKPVKVNNEVGSLSPVERLVDFELVTFGFRRNPVTQWASYSLPSFTNLNTCGS